MKNICRNILILASAIGMLCSCSSNKHLKQGEYILYDNKFTTTTLDSTSVTPEIEEALENKKSYIIQSHNKRFLGIKKLRWGLMLYSLSDPQKDNWINRFLRKQGEAPVIFDPNAAQQSANQLEQLLQSKGCFNSKVTFDTLSVRKNNITLEYSIQAAPRYIISDYTYNSESESIRPLIRAAFEHSTIEAGDYYDQDLLSAERDRIAQILQNSGYFLASKELISFEIDTTYTPGEMSIVMVIRKPEIIKNHKLTTTELDKYNINKITVDSNNVKTSTIRQVITMQENSLYRAASISESYNALLNLRNFKYINIELSESDKSTDSAKLVDAHIRLINNTKQNITASLELSNASPTDISEQGSVINNGNLGLETKLEYQNRNLFGGAELLRIEGALLLELPKLVLRDGAEAFRDAFTAFEAGINISLDMPDFIMPFSKHINWQRSRPHTIFSLGGDYQYRTYFERILGNTSFGYSWIHNRRHKHQLIPIELTYVNFVSIDDRFLKQLNATNDLRLKYQYSDHFIMDARYDYTYTNQRFNTRQNFNHFHASVETAGNLLKQLAIATNAPVDTSGIYQFVGVPFSQYAKFNIDAKRYFYHGQKSTFVARLMLGIGIPYGNSLSLPYEKSYFGGGPTTLRAWQLRRLGPGGYIHSNGDMLEHVGDISITINLEERFPIVGPLEGAIFTDIGNVWLAHPSEEYPLGNFSWDRFYKELGIGAGFGLRANISILTIRLDFAIPLYDPSYAESERWRFGNLKFNQFITNIGIDYPF